MLDLAIVGAEVVDGTGSPRRRADVGVKDGRIVAVGQLEERAARTVDGSGRIVAPGFIDVHTHYDAQVTWDPHLTPSPLHGVTTVIGGNCGFTLAPMVDDAAEYLVGLLSRVEGMPLDSLTAGLKIDWRTFAEYLDSMEGRVAVNAGFLVGHSTVRRIRMGDDWRRPASDDEIDDMARMIDESMGAGALGFSSSWSQTHSDGAGDPCPSRFASEEELIRLSSVAGRHPGTWLEFLPWATGPFPDERALLMARMSAAAKRPLNWNLLVVRPDISDEWIGNRLSASDLAAEHGGAVYGLTLPIPATLHINFESGFLFDSIPEWAAVLARPHHERVEMLRDPEVRVRLEASARAENRNWYDPDLLRIEQAFSERFAGTEGMTISEAARVHGLAPFDLLFEIAATEDLQTLFVVPPQGDDPESWQRRLKLWNDPRTIVGGSDAGAHLDLLATFGFFSDLVGPTVRDRQLLSLERAVQLITDDAARAFGLRGRGRVEPGFAADLVIFDESEVGTMPVTSRADLPAGGMRLYAEAKGIDHVVVNGDLIVESGALTDARPGTVLRSGRDTDTVTMG